VLRVAGYVKKFRAGRKIMLLGIFGWCWGWKIENTASDMDEQNQSGTPQKYLWPRFVLSGVILGIVLAIIWMAVLVHRVREQREFMVWPKPTNAMSQPTQSTTNSPLLTNEAVGH